MGRKAMGHLNSDCQVPEILFLHLYFFSLNIPGIQYNPSFLLSMLRYYRVCLLAGIDGSCDL